MTNANHRNPFPSDIEIARSKELKPIAEIACKLGISPEDLTPYGYYMAKVDHHLANNGTAQGNLILVTSISPTKSGVGKTTVSIGLAMALNALGHPTVVALREPSLGPCFGMKGGAAGGGYAQVLPMEKINLHFTGDFHAITSAHNMIAALLDNYIYQHQKDGFAMKEVLWRRVLDVNDRQLRSIVTGLGPRTNGLVQESGFDITPASELMVILCLARDEDDLRQRIDNILLGYTINGKPFLMSDLGVGGAIMALLLDAINPNLVQTTDNTPAFVHGGPFANIAHGCNSILATRMAMKYGKYAITEAGFGSDLGAEKFFDIKCRTAGIQPKLSVLVATLRALKLHGEAAQTDIGMPNAEALRKGMANMDRHIDNLHKFGQTVVVVLNRFGDDTEEEIEMVRSHLAECGVGFAVCEAFAKGSEGAIDLARLVVKTIDEQPSAPLRFAYEESDSCEEKICKVAHEIYHAGQVSFSAMARRKMADAVTHGYGHLPVCIAKTQYSFSTDPKRAGLADGAPFNVQDIVVNAGAGIIVAIAGDMVRMPGLPANPQANRIDVVNGLIEGLS